MILIAKITIIIKNLERLNFREQILYKIEYKLDNFFNIFNRTDSFYENNINKKLYYQMKSIKNKDVIDYLIGLEWIMNYYINLLDDTEFVYHPIKSPY